MKMAAAALALQQQIDDAGGVRAELEDELARLRRGEEDIRKQIALAQRNLSNAKSDYEDWETSALRQQIADAAGVRKELEAELETLRATEQGVRNRVVEARQALDVAKREFEEWDGKAKAATEARHLSPPAQLSFPSPLPLQRLYVECERRRRRRRRIYVWLVRAGISSSHRAREK